jgi:Ca2+-binding RTX toxin-like protein
VRRALILLLGVCCVSRAELAGDAATKADLNQTPNNHWSDATSWTFLSSSINCIDFYSGPDHCKFVNNTPITCSAYAGGDNSWLQGGSGNNYLYANGYGTTLVGGAGNNYLVDSPMAGASTTMIGGSGHNTFVIHTYVAPSTFHYYTVANPDVIQNKHYGDYIEYLGPQFINTYVYPS